MIRKGGRQDKRPTTQSGEGKRDEKRKKSRIVGNKGEAEEGGSTEIKGCPEKHGEEITGGVSMEEGKPLHFASAVATLKKKEFRKARARNQKKSKGRLGVGGDVGSA